MVWRQLLYDFFLDSGVSNQITAEIVWEEAGGTHSFVACISHFTMDHSFLSRRSTVAGGGQADAAAEVDYIVVSYLLLCSWEGGE